MTVALTVALLALDLAQASARVPFFKQKTATDCGRAVLTSLVAAHRGIPESAGPALQAIYRGFAAVPKAGYSFDEMQRLARSQGLAPRWHQLPVAIAGLCAEAGVVRAHLAGIEKHVAAGGTAVVAIATSARTNHYVIVTAFDKSGVEIVDPYAGRRTLPVDRLGKAMCSTAYQTLLF